MADLVLYIVLPAVAIVPVGYWLGARHDRAIRERAAALARQETSQ